MTEFVAQKLLIQSRNLLSLILKNIFEFIQEDIYTQNLEFYEHYKIGQK